MRIPKVIVTGLVVFLTVAPLAVWRMFMVLQTQGQKNVTSIAAL